MSTEADRWFNSYFEAVQQINLLEAELAVLKAELDQARIHAAVLKAEVEAMADDGGEGTT